MKFSIVTISFNQAEFLERAILSVLNQDYPEIEYIVVDPGSTDGSRDIIERYRDRIDRIVLKPDSGAAEGLNNGMAGATGEILGFLNSDDVLLPGAIARIVAAFRANKSMDLVTGHSYIIDAQNIRLRKSYTDKFHLRAFAYETCLICQQSTFFRADLFRKVGGFNEHNRIAWDAELFLNLLTRSDQYVVLDDFLSAFRLHSEAITGGAKLRELAVEFERAKFKRIMGRSWQPWDRAIRWIYLVRKYALEPRALLQRLRYGSIYDLIERLPKTSMPL
jgi:glycosyltransferase involved in cell wall biosynthesis